MGVIEVEIRPGDAAGTFAVQVLSSAAGESAATVTLDVDGLLGRLGQVQNAVLASAVSSRRVIDERERTLRQVGQELFAALLRSGEVAGRYRASAAMADAAGEGLRVV